MRFVPVVVVTLMWGLSFVATKFAVEVFPPFPAAFYRFLIATIVLLPFSKVKFKDLFNINALFAGFWGITMYFVFENSALTITSPTNAAIIVSTAPILYVLFTHIFHKRKTTLSQYLGMFLAFLGVAIVILGGESIRVRILGDLLAFGSAFAWVLYTHYVLKLKNYEGIQNTFLITFWGLVTLIPFSLTQNIRPQFEIKSLIALIYLGVFCSALGYLLWNKSIKLIGDRRTTNAVYFIPLVTVFSEKLLMGTGLTLKNIFGVIMVMLGLYIFERSEKDGKERLGN